jgi:ParB/RepB/Spo0J family partition protein
MAKEPIAGDKKKDVLLVDSRKLIIDEGYNAREEYGDIDGLAAEILAQGIKTPLKGYRKGEFFVVTSGHRRRLALKKLEKRGIPIIVPIIMEPKHYNPEERVLDLITDNDGMPLTPWEQSKVILQLSKFNWSDKDIASRSGKSIVYVRRLLSLANAPQKLINLVREGRVKGTLAMDMIAEGKVEELIKVAEKAPTHQNQDDIGDLFTSPAPAATPAKITKSDVQKPNSLKIFKKWVPKI